MMGTTRMLIEWRHLDLGGTCGRCSDTGANLWAVITELGQEHLLDNVELELENTILPLERMDESNVVLINGVPIEQILDPGVTVRRMQQLPGSQRGAGPCPWGSHRP